MNNDKPEYYQLKDIYAMNTKSILDGPRTPQADPTYFFFHSKYSSKRFNP